MVSGCLPCLVSSSVLSSSTWVFEASHTAPAGLSVKTACREQVAPAEVAASVGGSKAVPGLGCDGHVHAEGRREGHGTHVQGLEGGVRAVEGQACAR